MSLAGTTTSAAQLQYPFVQTTGERAGERYRVVQTSAGNIREYQSGFRTGVISGGPAAAGGGGMSGTSAQAGAPVAPAPTHVYGDPNPAWGGLPMNAGVAQQIVGVNASAALQGQSIPGQINNLQQDYATSSAELQRHWEEAKRGNETSFAARGQYNSGSYKRVQAGADRDRDSASAHLLNALDRNRLGLQSQADQISGGAQLSVAQILAGYASQLASDPNYTR